MIDSIKLLLGIEDNTQDELIGLYIDRAVVSIKNYLNTDKYKNVEIRDEFSEVIIALVENAHRESSSEFKGIKSKTQGARSITYADAKGFAITDDIKMLLPTPYIRMG